MSQAQLLSEAELDTLLDNADIEAEAIMRELFNAQRDPILVAASLLRMLAEVVIDAKLLTCEELVSEIRESTYGVIN